MVGPKLQILFEPLVSPFGLSVRSGVIGCQDVLRDPQATTEFSCEFGREAGISIAYDLKGESESFEHVMEVKACHAFCRYCLGTRDEECHLCTSLIGNGQYGILSLRQ